MLNLLGKNESKEAGKGKDKEDVIMHDFIEREELAKIVSSLDESGVSEKDFITALKNANAVMGILLAAIEEKLEEESECLK